MSKEAVPSFKIILPEGFDDRRQFETPLRGYLSDVIVELKDKGRYALYFIDPTRLQQDLDAVIKTGQRYIAEPGLIVLPQVTLEAIDEAVRQLWKDGYFENYRPLMSPTDQEYEAEFELLMQDAARLNELMDDNRPESDRAEIERLKIETRMLRDETRRLLASMGAKL